MKQEINEAELEICRRRGHAVIPSQYWNRCAHCGMWLREIRTVEERRTSPVDSELDPLDLLVKRIEKL